MTQHLIHIGYPKTGSSYLRRWFASHPQIAFSDGGIAGFDSVYDIARQSARAGSPVCRVTSAEGLATPHSQIGGDTIDYAEVRGFPMPQAQAWVCRTLAELFPAAIVLIVTRGFRSMLVSAYSQYVRTGGDHPFERFWPGPETGAGPWDYNRLVGLYEQHFGPDRVVVLPYELLRDEPAGFLREIELRLGLESMAELPATANRSVSPAEMAWYPRFSQWVRALPTGKRLERIYLRMVMANRLELLARTLQRLAPRPLVAMRDVPDAMLRAFEGCAECLRERPHYAPYLSDYLLTPVQGPAAGAAGGG